MPSIVGIISQKPPEECRRLVKAMVASMQHERFYVSGTCFVPEMGVHAGWIAHENSFAAGQVFWNEQRDVALVLSGECFLDSQTGVELRQKGHQIGTNEASWLVHLYEEQGDRFFEKLNGLFSGLLIDKRQHKAFLFNDRYGVERIYFHQTKDAMYFAGEAKALLNKGAGTPEPCRVANLRLCPAESNVVFQHIASSRGFALDILRRRPCAEGTLLYA